jgi:hypothetical protein
MLIGCAWVWAVGAGLWRLWEYQHTPGQPAVPSARWSPDSRIHSHRGTATLIVFAHPRCPCTRATISELTLLMARCRSRVTCHVLFFKPAGAANGWNRTDLWSSAAAIPGVTVSTDEGGFEARRFGAATSGQALLYAPDGQLLFSGGITPSRGHPGENAGREAITSHLLGKKVGQVKGPVFGCSLRGPAGDGGGRD